jgi:hypothetical protein
MRQPHLTSNGSHITTLRFIATIISILLGFITLPDVHCNYHCTNMPKVSKPKDRSSKVSQQTSQQTLRPRGNSHSPMENNTNTYIANINLIRDRFNNVLTSLGGLPSSTQDDAPPNSSDGTGNPSFPLGEPPADHKNNHITNISSPTGVDTLQAGILSSTNTANPSGNKQQQTLSNKGVCINETAVHVEPTMTPAGSTPRCCKSILHSSTNTRPPDHEAEDKSLTTTTTQPTDIHDRSQKLFGMFSNDGTEETSYHIIPLTYLADCLIFHVPHREHKR